ncbi:MAG: DMT family transporter [Planctomycetes bacterium]|nr:DMT family transporter [Planctomycetota bacterium]
MRSIAFLLIAVANVMGGLTYLAQRLALAGLPPATIAFLRNAVALACMAVYLLARGGITWRWTRPELVRLTVLGVLAYALPMLLGILGVQWSSAGNGSILILLEPPAILLFCWLLLGEHIPRRHALGVGLGLLGALSIVLCDDGASLSGLVRDDLLLGNVLLAVHGLLWGLYSPVMRPLAQVHRATDVTFASMLIGNVLLLPAALCESGAWVGGDALLPALGWTLALGVFGSWIATVMWNASLRTLSASAVAPFVLIQPLAGVAGDYLADGLVPSAAAATGGALIASAVLIVIWPTRRRTLTQS